MRLRDLIKRLEQESPDKVLAIGLGKPHSWRGSYDELAMEPVTNTTVGEVLEVAKSAIGKTFEGYKGGDFRMHEFTPVHIAKWGEWEAGFPGMLLDFMLNQSKVEE